MKTAALYIRVSTDDQVEYSPDAQKRLLIDYAKKNDIAISNQYVFIESVSGKKADKRPEFQNMISLAKSKERPFDTILVWKYSRFARNQEESIVYKSLLKKNDVDVISISEPIIDGPFGSLIERIIEWMDEYYSIRLAGEVKRGMTEKAMRGEYQASAPYGYYSKDGQLLLDQEKAAIIKNIFDMYLYDAANYFSIARKLNDMGVTTNRGNKFENRTIQYILQNPVYKGYTRWNPDGKLDLRMYKYHSSNFIVKKGTHEPIVSEEIWEEVNKKILLEFKPKHSRPSSVLKHWLGGVLTCKDCGSALVSTGADGGFQCNGYSKGRCKVSHYVSHRKIEQAVLNALKELVDGGDFDYSVVSIEALKGNVELLRNNLKKLDIKEKRIKEAYINSIDTMEEYKENKQALEKERLELEEQIRLSSEVKKTKKTKNAQNKQNKNCLFCAYV